MVRRRVEPGGSTEPVGILPRHERQVTQVVRRCLRGVASGEYFRHRGNAQVAINYQPDGSFEFEIPHIMELWRTLKSIHKDIAIINRFSVRETKPSGTRLDPPTQAHLSSRF